MNITGIEDLKPGREIPSYRLIMQKGKGQTGVVYKALQLDIERVVAIKFLRTDFSEEEQYDNPIRRFEREIKILSGLRHVNVVDIRGRDRILAPDKRPILLYYVMEYIEGHSLEDLRSKTISAEAMFSILKQIANGLAAIHSKGVVHRDFKPANVMISIADEVVKITDFGFAKILTEEDEWGSPPGKLGDPQWHVPWLKHTRDADAQSDIYQFGLVIRWLMTQTSVALTPRERVGLEDLTNMMCVNAKAEMPESVHFVYENLSKISDVITQYEIEKEMVPLLLVPEISTFGLTSQLIRVPEMLNVHVTSRTLKLIDTEAFQRLRHVRQLGPTSLVYPGATHSRFEHSLGVFSLVRRYIGQLVRLEEFRSFIEPEQILALVAGALTHDIGHHPFSHAIGEMGDSRIPDHERRSEILITEGEIADILDTDWGLDPSDVYGLIRKRLVFETRQEQLLHSILSGPLDVDKMDYLERDSIHLGVPYGRNYDKERLISSLTLNRDKTELAITDKGKAAAEIFIFSRYIMFSEVYWHHTVRSATAMIKRAVYDALNDNIDVNLFFLLDDLNFLEKIRSVAPISSSSYGLLKHLMTTSRELYKSVRTYNLRLDRSIYPVFKGMDYCRSIRFSNKLCRAFAEATSEEINDHDVLVDIPPAEKEVEIKVDVFYPKRDEYLPLDRVSPMCDALVTEFDEHVKCPRIFCHPRLRQAISGLGQLELTLV